eukprot:593567-Pelagomonas_calceolata.AAC.1
MHLQVAAGSVMDAHAAALGSLRDNIAALERTVASHPDAVESVRSEVRALAKDLEQAQRSVSGTKLVAQSLMQAQAVCVKWGTKVVVVA